VVRAIRGEAVGTLVCRDGPPDPRGPGARGAAADRVDDGDEDPADG